MMSPWQKRAVRRLEGIQESPLDPLKKAEREMNILLSLYLLPVVAIFGAIIYFGYIDVPKEEEMEKVDAYQAAMTEWEKEIQNGAL